MTDPAILWSRLDGPGHDAASVGFRNGRRHLSGTALLAEGGEPCRLNYRAVCGRMWRTESARIVGWVGREMIKVELSVDSAGRWRLNGAESPEVAGCVDVDFGFTPATNFLPIGGLNLAIGEEAEIRSAWLRFPGFSLEPLPQRYRRTDVLTYRYESPNHRFAADLQVNAAGFVTDYPGRWRAEATID